jgi:hypothetical protein
MTGPAKSAAANAARVLEVARRHADPRWPAGGRAVIITAGGRADVAAAITATGTPILPGPHSRWSTTIPGPDGTYLDVLTMSIDDKTLALFAAGMALAHQPPISADGEPDSTSLDDALVSQTLTAFEHGPYGSEPPMTDDPAAHLLAVLLADTTQPEASDRDMWNVRLNTLARTAVTNPHLVDLARREARLAAQQPPPSRPVPRTQARANPDNALGRQS